MVRFLKFQKLVLRLFALWECKGLCAFSRCGRVRVNYFWCSLLQDYHLSAPAPLPILQLAPLCKIGLAPCFGITPNRNSIDNGNGFKIRKHIARIKKRVPYQNINDITHSSYADTGGHFWLRTLPVITYRPGKKSGVIHKN